MCYIPIQVLSWHNDSKEGRKRIELPYNDPRPDDQGTKDDKDDTYHNHS